MAKGVTFQVAYPVRKAEELEGIAKKAAVLKKHGQVEVIVGKPAGRSDADLPPGGSAWHEYTTYLSTWQRLFPHPKMKPFVDMKYVAKNRALLEGMLKVLRKHGYAAGMSCHTPFYLPEEFFQKYPHLRGPQCDHPRRTRREAFSLCVDQPEVLEMYREMSREMGKAIPELQWMKIMTNDAGAGLCWSDWLYPGPNGPEHCKHISTGERSRKMMEAIREGMGHPIEFVLNGNFSAAEMRELAGMVNEDFHFEVHHTKEDEHQVNTGCHCDNPVRGIFNPVEILRILARTKNPGVRRVGLGFAMNYTRGHDTEDAAEKVIEVVDEFFKEPAYGTVERFALLRKICEKWVGAKKRDELLEAFVAMDEAFKAREQISYRFTGNYQGVTMRHINRPLVLMPEKLTPEEESYFLPFIFNPDLNEARMDYRDGHGGKLSGGNGLSVEFVNSNPRIQAFDRFTGAMKKVAGVLEDMGGTAAGETLQRLGISLRLYGGVIRSANNFISAGIVRDRNLHKLSGPAHVPPKVGDWVGDPDLQLLNEFMRDELDNAGEMVGLLENGGLEQMLVAPRAEDEDMFLLGPDLIEQMRKKYAIMGRHWIDAQQYMSTPHK